MSDKLSALTHSRAETSQALPEPNQNINYHVELASYMSSYTKNNMEIRIKSTATANDKDNYNQGFEAYSTSNPIHIYETSNTHNIPSTENVALQNMDLNNEGKYESSTDDSEDINPVGGKPKIS